MLLHDCISLPFMLQTLYRQAHLNLGVGDVSQCAILTTKVCMPLALLCRARLQVGTGENAYALQSGYAHIGVLHKELGELKVQVEEMQTLLRKQKEEQEEERRRQTKEVSTSLLWISCSAC